MTSFLRENQLVQTKKNSLSESSWFGEPKCKMGSKVAHFFILGGLFHYFLLLLLLKFCENGRRIYCLRTLSRAHQLPHLLINSRVNMTGFVNPCKVVARKRAFSTLPNAWNGSENRLLKKKEIKKSKSKSKVNLILSIVNHTFLILDPQIGPRAFRHTHCTSIKKCFF